MASRDAVAGPPALNAAAGAVAGSLVLSVLFPVDLCKSIMQARGTGVVDTVRSLMISGTPFRRLYRGIVPALAETTLNRSMLFGVASMVKRHVPAEWPEPLRDATSGALAAFSKTSLLHPLDTIKCRWQVGLPLSELGGLYHGLGPALLRSSGGMGIWLASRNHLERVLPDDSRGWRASRHLVAGAASTVLTDLCTFPFDTLKKSMQASSAGAREAPISSAARLLSEGGMGRFYRGYGARLVLVSTNGALFNACFVALKDRMGALLPW